MSINKTYLLLAIMTIVLTNRSTFAQTVSFTSTDDFAFPVAPGSPSYIHADDFNGDGFTDIWTSFSPLIDSMAVFLNNGSGEFSTAAVSFAGTDAWTFVLADFNGDGNTDVIAEADYELSFMAGTGTGYFAPPVSASSANVEADQYLAADFNNDGSMDIVSGQISYCDDSIYFHFGNGDGTLDMPEGYRVDYPHGMATGDFNGDGFTDITIHSRDSLLVLLNDGGGNFSAGAIASFSTFAFELLIVSDLNGDGTDDIATISKYLNTNKLKTFMGNGDGTFQAPATLSLPYQTDYAEVIAVKLTQNTYPDLVFTCPDNFVQVYQANGDGTFNLGPKYPAGGYPWYLVSADFNGDAYPDIATANISSDNISVLNGKPDGTLDAYIHEHYIGDFLYSVTTGDFNEDGLADLSASLSQLYDLDFFAMMYGDGTAQFALDNKLYEPAGPVIAGEFTGDSHEDLLMPEGTEFTVYPGLGNGQFDSPVSSPGTRGYNSIGDINGDGHSDLIITTSFYATDSLKIFEGNGDGSFSFSYAFTGFCRGTSNATGDFDGDGDADLIIGWENDFYCTGFLKRLLNDGTGIFSNLWSLLTDVSPRAIVTGDFNNDSFIDFAFSDDEHYKVMVFFGNGAGYFNAAFTIPLKFPPTQLAADDFNNDGFPDLVTISDYTSDEACVMINDGNGNFSIAGYYTTGSNPVSIAVNDFNEDGKRDIAVGNYQSGSVTLLLNETSIATQIEEVEPAGHEISLDVFPNPFSSSAEIQFSLINASDIKLELYDLQGKKIRTIADGNFSDGNHHLIIECNDMGSGIYLLQFVSGLSSITQKIIVTKQ